LSRAEDLELISDGSILYDGNIIVTPIDAKKKKMKVSSSFVRHVTLVFNRRIRNLYRFSEMGRITTEKNKYRTLSSYSHDDNFDSSILKICPSVQEALNNNQPVVALESTIIAHGMPYPANVDLALELNQMLKERNVEPATIGM
jgi:Indigoidine synthase A like protein